MRINFRRQYTALCSFLIGGTGAFLYAIHETVKRLDSILDPNVLKLNKSTEYIYIQDSNLEFSYSEDCEEDKDLSWWVFGWWERRKVLLLWRLVELANLSDKDDRRRSVEILASYTDLHDYQYYQLAQASNAQTLVALARIKNVDKRFFKKRKHRCKCNNQKELVNASRDLLAKLCTTSRHPCLHYFLSKVFPKTPKYKVWSYVSDLDVYGFVHVPPTTISEETVLPLCIDALAHHFNVSGDYKALVESGALQLLFECQDKLSSDFETCYRISGIITQLSTQPEFLQDLFQTGWLRVLAGWLYGQDSKLSTMAATCLANLDCADREPLGSYEKEVVLLHPSYRSKEEVKADVVLIHGLLGGVHYTWRQRRLHKQPVSIFGMTDPEEPLLLEPPGIVLDEEPEEMEIELEPLESDYVFVMTDIPETESACCNTTCSFEGDCLGKLESMQKAEYTTCWPKDWLPKDCKHLRVLGINYDTRLTDWTNWCPLRDRNSRSNRQLVERCKKLLSHLLECGLGERPVIWITHSMGGIVLKHLLMQAWNSQDLNSKKICENTKGAVFLSTPHIGSPWASLHDAWRFFIWPSTEVDELRYQSPALQKLHKDFLSFVEEHPIDIVSFVETKSMKISEFEWEFHCVPPNIGDTGAGIIYGIPLGHLDICKPDGKFSFIYQRILSLVRSIVEKSEQRPSHGYSYSTEKNESESVHRKYSLCTWLDFPHTLPPSLQVKMFTRHNDHKIE